MVSIVAFQAVDRGSIPRRGTPFLPKKEELREVAERKVIAFKNLAFEEEVHNH